MYDLSHVDIYEHHVLPDLSHVDIYEHDALRTGGVDDVYWYAQCLYHTGQYHRASHVIRSRKLDRVSHHNFLSLLSPKVTCSF